MILSKVKRHITRKHADHDGKYMNHFIRLVEVNTKLASYVQEKRNFFYEACGWLNDIQN
jgi:hypothetical protein